MLTSFETLWFSEGRHYEDSFLSAAQIYVSKLSQAELAKLMSTDPLIKEISFGMNSLCLCLWWCWEELHSFIKRFFSVHVSVFLFSHFFWLASLFFFFFFYFLFQILQSPAHLIKHFPRFNFRWCGLYVMERKLWSLGFCWPFHSLRTNTNHKEKI